MKRIPATIEEFVEACKTLSNEDIYVLFEDDISEELRGEIYNVYTEETPEPCRAALQTLGEKYNVESLINY